MSKPSIEGILFLALTILVISFPKETDASRIATTLYEDLKNSALVVAGRIVQEKTNDNLTTFDLEVGNIIYGDSNSSIVSIVTRGRRVKGKDGLSGAHRAFYSRQSWLFARLVS